MTFPADWANLGIFPLRDHDEDTPIDMRLMLVGQRVKHVDLETGEVVNETEDGLGTVGDIHPWRYWGPRSREERPMGSYAQVFACEVQRGGGQTTPSEKDRARPTYTGPADAVPPGVRNPYPDRPDGPGGQKTASAKPIRRDDYKGDPRYKTITHKLPPGMNEPPAGTIALALAGTEEHSEERLLIPLEGGLRLICVNWSPPGDMGTQVFDLEPDGTIAPHRGARLQSAWRVIRFMGPLEGLQNAEGNGLAWQLTTSQQDLLAGYGACYGKLDDSVPGLGGPEEKDKGPISGTPNPNINQGAQNMSGGSTGAFGGSGGVNPGNVPGVRYGTWG